MKIFHSPRAVALTIVFLLAGLQQLSAQWTNDASVYPGESLLPGKPTGNVWTGLAKVWAQRHAQWAKTQGQDDGGVVFLGDSITQGWTSLTRDFPNFKAVNRGIGGDTTQGVLYRLYADVLSLKPKAIVLLIGTNDIGNGGDPSAISDNIKEILKDVRKDYPKIPVIVCEVMPSSETKQRPPDKIEKLNKLIRRDVRWHRHTYLCDTWSIYAEPNGDAPQALFRDLLHPNAAGYAKWKTALDPIFAKLNIQTAN